MRFQTDKQEYVSILISTQRKGMKTSGNMISLETLYVHERQCLYKKLLITAKCEFELLTSLATTTKHSFFLNLYHNHIERTLFCPLLK